MKYFAVLDTETNWHDEVMSIGAVIADAQFSPCRYLYYILSPEYKVGGMFSSTLSLPGMKPTAVCSRFDALRDFEAQLAEFEVEDIFAYNAGFDLRHLPELTEYKWYDIMSLAVYKQYNPHITDEHECFKTGRLKHNCGVECILQLLSANSAYREKHNALTDAADELTIMKLLGHEIEKYTQLKAIKR